MNQNFVLKFRLVFKVKVLFQTRSNLEYKSDFQNEILALLPPKSAKTFHETLQTLEVITIQTFTDRFSMDVFGR